MQETPQIQSRGATTNSASSESSYFSFAPPVASLEVATKMSAFRLISGTNRLCHVAIFSCSEIGNARVT